MQIDSCGNFSKQLNNIYLKVLEGKKANGEKTNRKDEELIDENIFKAYQIILSVAKDKTSISGAIKNLELQIEQDSSSNILEVANAIVKDAQIYEQPKENSNVNEVVNATVAAIAVSGIVNYNREETEKSIGKVDKVLDGLNIEDGRRIVFEEPENPNLKFKNEDEKLIEEEIEKMKTASIDIFLQDNTDPKKFEKNKRIMEGLRENSTNDLWIDSYLRGFNYLLQAKEPEKALKDPLVRSEFERLIEVLSPENVSKTEFVDDKYTMKEKLGIMLSILAANKEGKFEKNQGNIVARIKNIDPQLYEFACANLDMLLELRDSTNGFEDIVAETPEDGRDTFMTGLKSRVRELEKNDEEIDK